ncbi:metallophosphoesterase [Rhodospirillaceae bacterium]|nr:metallophosphoesterase [Rhodospirillaceae bacterium]
MLIEISYLIEIWQMQVVRTEWQESPRPIEDGIMAIAIGDVHGCSQHLEAMYRSIAEDVETLTPNNITCILIGDLIDRGQNSKECLRLATQGLSFFTSEININDIVLMGNHDLWLCHALNGQLTDSDFQAWMRNGGKATLSSLGVATNLPFESVQTKIKNSISPDIITMLTNMCESFQIGQLFFVHAGIDPRYSLTHQTLESKLWIRDEFLTPTTWPFNEIIIHGHTIEHFTKKPKIYNHRIGIDSGVYATDILTGIEFMGAMMRFIMIQPDG